ncbi:MAG: hypothetical protein PHR35_02500 [Kiritimatiellae bacterium]|nr:hypothetical protein [Kiritimatiellia bacterium]
MKASRDMQLLCSLTVLLGVASGFADLAPEGAGYPRVRKKLIESGWGMPDTQWLPQNLAEMEQQPFDGITLRAVGHRNASNSVPLTRAFNNEEWESSWFQSCVDDLRACAFARFTDNFVAVSANPGNVDWFDDQAWNRIATHWRIAAWIAKQGDLKGILFDPEPYEGPHQFQYKDALRAQLPGETRSFDATCAKARERGRQVMKSLAREYADMTILCYFMNSYNSGVVAQNDVRAGLEEKVYGLYPAFIDGWLDAAPSTMTFVDGCEGGYLFNSAGEYLEQALAVKNVCQQLVSPANRAKYRAQVQTGFPIYLNVYMNSPGSNWSLDMKGQSPLERLRVNLDAALRVTDEYVWMYNEVYRWWPLSGREPMAYAMKSQRWPEVFPGCARAMRLAGARANGLDDYARERLGAETIANLARNCDFGSDTAGTNAWGCSDWKEGGAPAGWTTWQADPAKGVFAWDRGIGCTGKGSARMAGVQIGCFIQTYKVNPAECYAIRAKRRVQGTGKAVITVRWQSPGGKWTAEAQDRRTASAASDREWKELGVALDVPQGVGILVLLLGAEGQATPEDQIWYDDIRVHRLD